MEVTGACQCGAITYRAVVDPEQVRLCHCTDCQRFSGSAYRVSVPTVSGTFQFLSGVPRIYIKTADSGTRRAQAFCANCGSTVYSAAETNPSTYSLRVGCLDQRAQLKPRRQIWHRSAIAWSADLHDVPAIEGQ